MKEGMSGKLREYIINLQDKFVLRNKGMHNDEWPVKNYRKISQLHAGLFKEMTGESLEEKLLGGTDELL